MDELRMRELFTSQLPALQLLVGLGFQYLAPKEALALRGGKAGAVLLEPILRERLKAINRIRYKGGEFLFSEENIQSAIQRLKAVRQEGLLKTNEAIHELLTLGIALEQTIEGDQKSFSLRYVDWEHPENNAFHVTAEFSVERSRSQETARPDLVLFVNGLPWAVIECKAPNIELAQAVSQMIRNQTEEYIPRLFGFVQLVLGVNKNGAKYATTGTAAKFWSVWREPVDEGELVELLERPLPEAAKGRLYDLVMQECGTREAPADYLTERRVTEQDRAIYSLCRPERLLELARIYTVFDGGQRKLARYPQYRTLRKTLARVERRDADGRREGGVVWHTQGSGKSLTMVMLARALALGGRVRDPRIVLVTDRVDLDQQLGETFRKCGLPPARALSGRHLVELVCEDKPQVITTLVHKFDKALRGKAVRDESPDIFMLVDESHRTQFGSFAARMRQMFPRACYIGFTGTPLLKQEKNSFAKFGGLIDAYPITEAVEDGAVVPLLYEARHAELEQNEKAIDLWFERHTERLTDEQKVDLKRKYSRAEMLNKAEQVIYMRAFDISAHYRTHWQGRGYKAQLVAPGKEAALQYKRFLDEIGGLSSEVVISPPDTREGYEVVDERPADAVVEFWQRMMKRFGTEEQYNRQLINAFKNGDEPEILIVVDKLLTGFDAPRNAVLYLARPLREHALLQAIARVNRLCEEAGVSEPKEFGYIIDYVGVLGELDKAMTAYDALSEFDEEDLRGALRNIQEEVRKLPQRHADLREVFKTVKNRGDEEEYEALLADEKLRHEFYERLAAFGRALAVALSSERFLAETPAGEVGRYKADHKRFSLLRTAVRLRYAEAVDYREYEPKLKKLLDAHISASEVVRLTEAVNIFDAAEFEKVVEAATGGKSTAAKADMIAHATRRAISERLELDPAFYKKLSEMIRETIEDFRARRISEVEYLKRATRIRDEVVGARRDDVPAAIRGDHDAVACYGILWPRFRRRHGDPEVTARIAAEAARRLWAIVRGSQKVGFWDDLDAQKQMKNAIDDYLYDEVRGRSGVSLEVAEMDEIIQEVTDLARARTVA